MSGEWNEILEGGLNQALAKRLGMQTGSPSPVIMPEMGAALVLENDRPEWAWLKQDIYCSARSSQAAVAAQFTIAALCNPTGSGIVAVVELIETTPAASTGLIKVRDGGAVAGTLVTSAVRDARGIPIGGTARGACVMTVSTLAGATPEAAVAWFPASASYAFAQPIVLRPGSHVLVELATANIASNSVAFHWHERAGLPGELG